MIIADTGYWLALANRRDRFHQQAIAVTRTLNETLVTTWPVLTETCHLLSTRLHPSAQNKLLAQAQQGLFQLYELHIGHLPRIHILMEQYADLPMDLADASLMIVAEEIGRGDILSTDRRDFNTYRWKNHYPFNNLLLPN